MEWLLRQRQRDRGRRGQCGHFLNEMSTFDFFKNIGCVDSRQRGNSSLAPQEITHLAAIGKLESEFIYKMAYSWLLCACHKRLNNNSFHVHHTRFPSANSAQSLLICQIDGLCRGLNDTEHQCTVFDQTAPSKLQQCCHVRVLSLTACTNYCAWRCRASIRLRLCWI